MTRRLLAITFLLIVGINKCSCVDLPTFYRAPLFQGEAIRNVKDFATHIEARYAHGNTQKSFNAKEDKTCLFNTHCACDLRKLAENLESLTSKPLTQAYVDGQVPKLYDGTMGFSGRFEIDEFDFTIQQNLLYGLYLQAYLPFRKLSIQCIDHKQSVTAEAGTGEAKVLDDFVTNDLDNILAEHDIQPYKTPYRKSELSDPLVSLGWHGHCIFEDTMVTSIRGFMQAGVVIPAGSKKDQTHLFSVPTSYNQHWGINARGNIHATIWDNVAIGANAGATIFMQRTYSQRMTTTTDQCGWIVLGKGCATTDPGTIWDATLYIKAEQIYDVFSFLFGYSYVQQEQTVVTIKDNNFLKTALANKVIHSKSEVINSNKRLKPWYYHTLHAYAQYESDSFLLRASYDYPILAKHTFATAMVGGTLGVTVAWGF